MDDLVQGQWREEMKNRTELCDTQREPHGTKARLAENAEVKQRQYNLILTLLLKEESQPWWHIHVTPALWELEAGVSAQGHSVTEGYPVSK